MSKMIEIEFEGDNIPAYLAEPAGTPKGGLIVIHEVWGLQSHTKSIADRLAKEGYVVIAPNLLSEIGITEELAGSLAEELFDPERRTQAQPKIRELMTPMQAPGFGEKTIARVRQCFEYLIARPELKEKIGVIGFCFGGTYSFSLAVHEPRLKIAIPFYGHADFTSEELSNISCPVLAFYGENDERLMEALPELKDNMKKAGVNFRAEVYKNAGHAFFNDTNRFAYNEGAAKDAWDKTISFLSDNL